MAQPIGALRADISASTANFSKGMKKAKQIAKQNSSAMQRSFAKLKGGVGKLTKSLFSLKGGIIALAGPAVIGLLIKKSLAAADKIAKMSDAAGISTDMMQELSHTANIAGIETSALQGAMTKFTKGIGEAKVGTGVMVTILRKLDEELLNSVMASKTAEDAFDLIMRSAAKMTDATKRAALMAAAFGRTAGTQMALLIKDGVESLDDLRQEAHRLGIVIDEDLLRGAEAANDAMTRLGSSIKSRVTSAVLTLAPAIENLANRLIEGLPAIINWVQWFGELIGVLEKLPKAELEAINTEIGKLEKATAGASGFEKVLRKIGGDILDLKEIKTIDELNAKLQGLYARRVELLAIIKKQEGQAKTTAEGTDTITAALEAEGVAIGGLRIILDTFHLKTLSNIEFERQAYRAYIEEKVQLAQDAVNQIASIGENLLGIRKAQIQEELDADIKRVLASTRSEEDKAAAIENLRNQAVLDEKAAAKKMKKIQYAQAVISGAAAALKTFEKYGFTPKGFGMVLLGAAATLSQLALIKAQSFAKGGIIDRPTLIPMRRGTALAGEAGREAIMPLTRMPGGDLGVQAAGGKSIVFNQYLTFEGPVTNVEWIRDEVAPQLEADARRLLNKIKVAS